MGTLREQINGVADCQRELADVPEWNLSEPVFIRNLTAQELDSWQCETYALNGTEVSLNRQNIRSRLVARCLVDETGRRVFTDEQAHELGAKNTKVVERLYKIAERLNAVTKKDVEDLAKNS